MNDRINHQSMTGSGKQNWMELEIGKPGWLEELLLQGLMRHIGMNTQSWYYKAYKLVKGFKICNPSASISMKQYTSFIIIRCLSA
jgi:hypothetical protein